MVNSQHIDRRPSGVRLQYMENQVCPKSKVEVSMAPRQKWLRAGPTVTVATKKLLRSFKNKLPATTAIADGTSMH